MVLPVGCKSFLPPLCGRYLYRETSVNRGPVLHSGGGVSVWVCGGGVSIVIVICRRVTLLTTHTVDGPSTPCTVQVRLLPGNSKSSGLKVTSHLSNSGSFQLSESKKGRFSF